MTTENIVIYHANCSDGLGAAFACWKKFGGENTAYIPCSYGTHWSTLIHDNVIPVLSEIEIFIVDFSFPKEQILDMCMQCKFVTIYDHHDTARQDLFSLQDIRKPTNLEIVFDMERSGAGITWDELHGRNTRPHLIDLIEDRDLWKFEFGHQSKALQLFINETKPSIAQLDDLTEPEILGEVVASRMSLVAYQAAMVADVAKEQHVVETELGIISFINAPYHMASDLGEYVGKVAGCDIVCIWRYSPEHRNISMSLRTKSDTIHCGEICRDHFNGGGHQKAAGGYLPTFEFFEHFMKGIL